MLTVGLFPNLKKTRIDTVVSWLVQHFQERKVRVLLPEEAARELNFPELAADMEQLTDQIQLAVTLGGDGTLINAAREVAPAGIPVCGVNMGQLGYLTEIELPDLAPAVDKLIRGEYSIEERLMLDAFILRGDEELFVSSALNDVVVTKGGLSRLIRLKLFIDDELAANYPADGVIVATSTGSTGYSLSAGGPIINPKLKVIVLTPICPHSLQARSLLVSEKEEIKITMNATHDDIVLTVDGQTLQALQPDDIVIVRRATFRARFARFAGRSFAHALRTKLWRDEDDEAR
ncbi:MAG TPA: NAD(+)/NADH kinase [Selenomonadales bacterium]|nr:NAD(+)/NADH kinase [Selenomonadales bacterium]